MTRLLGLLLFALSLFACDKDSATTTTTVADTATADATVEPGPDVPTEDPCLGLKVQKQAATYNSECDGIDKCTLMPSKDSGCWCAYCGPQGTKIVCVQAQCATPGGTP